MSAELIAELREEVGRPSNSAMGIHPHARKLCATAADEIEELQAKLNAISEVVYDDLIDDAWDTLNAIQSMV